MSLYEHVYLARQDASAQQVEELTAHLKSVVEGLGGSVAKTEYWGVKSLSYRLRKNRKAHFTLLNIDAPSAAINEIERLERLNEDVVRYLTIRVDELEEGPSAMMRRAERDRDRDERRGDRFDRGDRGDRFDRGDRPRDRDRERRPREGSDEIEAVTGESSWPCHRNPAEGAGRSFAAARAARSRAPMRRRSTIKTSSSCSASCRNAARSCQAASPPSRQRSSASSRKRSSARAFLVCCLT
jgi:small subunit ribosomal protein S6